MAKLLPKWVMKRYLLLWKSFGSKEFDYEQACKTLSTLEDSKQIVSIVLSELKRANWVDVSLNNEDARKRNYQLKPYEAVFESIISELNKQVK